MSDNRPVGLTKKVMTAPQQIAAHIKDSILEGSLRPGERLPTEEEMARLFGVSRPTVREALRYLRTTRVVESVRGRYGGYRIAEFSLHELETNVGEFISLSLAVETLNYAQLFEVRQSLEVLSAGAAANLRTEEDLLRLALAVPDPSIIRDDHVALLNSDLAFHRALAECTHNPLIIGFAGATATAFRRFSGDLRKATPELLVAYLPEVVEAVRSKDAPAARDAMKRHLGYFARYFGVDQP